MEIATIIKGFIVGAFMLVPGVSGGTMCMVFKIYDRLIAAVSRFTQDIRRNLLFLVQFVAGAGIAFLLLSGLVTTVNKSFPQEVAFFVIGAILAGIPVIYREARIEKFSFPVVLYAAGGLALVFLLGQLPKNLFTVEQMGPAELVVQLLAGVLGALGLVLPGISFSAMLYMMGVYNFIYGAIADRHFLVLIPFGIGMVLGVFLLTRALEVAMKRYPTPTYMIILGFVVGSLGDIVKEMGGAPAGARWLVCLLLLVLGFVIIHALDKWEDKRKDGKKV